MSILNVYAPREEKDEDEEEDFYKELEETCNIVDKHCLLTNKPLSDIVIVFSISENNNISYSLSPVNIAMTFNWVHILHSYHIISYFHCICYWH